MLGKVLAGAQGSPRGCWQISGWEAGVAQTDKKHSSHKWGTRQALPRGEGTMEGTVRRKRRRRKGKRRRKRSHLQVTRKQSRVSAELCVSQRVWSLQVWPSVTDDLAKECPSMVPKLTSHGLSTLHSGARLLALHPPPSPQPGSTLSCAPPVSAEGRGHLGTQPQSLCVKSCTLPRKSPVRSWWRCH